MQSFNKFHIILYSNRPYFDLCDGIFLNYNWTNAGLSASKRLAQERRGEVYVGIDVFGRGCPGGGGYNSCEVSEFKIERNETSWSVLNIGVASFQQFWVTVLCTFIWPHLKPFMTCFVGAEEYSWVWSIQCPLCPWVGLWDARKEELLCQSKQVCI